MDADFWAARVHSAKNFSALQDARLDSSNHLIMDDEGDDEMRAWFPCPFCYVDIEVHMLCIHLQEEHCFGFQNAVCPICAANLGRDALSHFTMQHSHSIKRRRKSQKPGFWSNVSTNIVKDIRELSSFSISGHTNAHEVAPDPLLLPFLCNVPLLEPQDSQKDASYTATTNDVESKKMPVQETEEEDYQERKQRASFLQELVASTIFSDSMEEN